MSLDPTKWIRYEELSQPAQAKIEQMYPYLKVDQAQFQEKQSGVFMRNINTGKVEKLMEPPRPNPKGTPATPAAAAAGSARSRR
jgi:hypothetical protein